MLSSMLPMEELVERRDGESLVVADGVVVLGIER